jgi:hypothetical protein
MFRLPGDLSNRIDASKDNKGPALPRNRQKRSAMMQELNRTASYQEKTTTPIMERTLSECE